MADCFNISCGVLNVPRNVNVSLNQLNNLRQRATSRKLQVPFSLTLINSCDSAIRSVINLINGSFHCLAFCAPMILFPNCSNKEGGFFSCLIFNSLVNIASMYNLSVEESNVPKS